MKKFFFFLLSVALLACGNKKDLTERTINDNRSELSDRDTVVTSSPQSTQSNNNDNIRGFDPASEDDMDDNGMSRYMENNDDEGWD